MNLGNLVIVEDDTYTRSLLKTSLTSIGFSILASGSTAREGLAPFEEVKVDVALLDLDLGKGPNGKDVAYKMREMQPNVGLILITSFTEYRAVGASSRSFPIGMRHLRKSDISDISQLVKVILETKARPLTRVPRSPVERGPLTDKQIDVLRYINQGLSNQEIARQMDVTVGAIEKSISRINNVLGFENNSSLNARTLLIKYFAKLTGKDPGSN